jgi:hypothetical protein
MWKCENEKLLISICRDFEISFGITRSTDHKISKFRNSEILKSDINKSDITKSDISHDKELFYNRAKKPATE